MAFSHIILLLCISQVIPTIWADTYKCKEPNQELVNQLENHYGLDISNVDQVLTYEYKDFLVDPPFNNYTSLVFDNIKVKFAGYLLLKGKNSGIITKKTFDTNTVDVRHHTNNQKNQCQVVKADFMKTYRKDSNFKLGAIHRLTIGCLEEFICEEWDKFIAHDSRVKQEFETTINKIFKKNANANQTDGHYDIQSTWNSVFDIGKSIAIEELLNKNGGVLALPDLNQNFTKLYIDGHILMKEMSVEGLYSLERTKDIAVNRCKNRYEFSTGIQLKNLKVKIPNYRVNWGSSVIDGHVGVTFSKLAVNVKVYVDYNSVPCEIEVDELNQDNLEQPKVEFTGLGPLNWAVREVAEYYLKNDLVEELRKTIGLKISQLNCAKYRSAVESVKF